MKKQKVMVPILIIVFLLFSAILKKTFIKSENYSLNKKESNMKLTTVFEHNGNIPSVYTCDGEDSAPELTLSEVPETAQELVLIVDDPDAPMGTWVHWVLYNIPVNTKTINAKNLPAGTKQGMTDFGRIGWGGPCPPNGTHRYFFKLYALDKKLELSGGMTKAQVEAAIKNHVIDKTELIGLYKRNK